MIYNTLNIYTDGSCLKNPGGKCGCAAVLNFNNNNKILYYQKYLGSGTNNIAEYKAIILALETSLNLEKKYIINIFSDSKIAVNQINGEFKTNNENLDVMKKKVLAITQKLKSDGHYAIKFIHIKAHRGDPFNEFADKLAYTAATDEITTMLDPEDDDVDFNKKIVDSSHKIKEHVLAAPALTESVYKFPSSGEFPVLFKKI